MIDIKNLGYQSKSFIDYERHVKRTESSEDYLKLIFLLNFVLFSIPTLNFLSLVFRSKNFYSTRMREIEYFGIGIMAISCPKRRRREKL
jgi:hypothetical protein